MLARVPYSYSHALARESEDGSPASASAETSDVEQSAGLSWLPGLVTASASGWLCFLAAATIIFAASFATIRVGLPHIAIYGHDTFILFDGAWRVLNGQRPHVDFYSGFGPVGYLAAAGGLFIAHFSPEGVVYATAAWGIVVGGWAFALVRRRLAAWSALSIMTFLMFFWLAPFPLGEAFYLASYAMQYNRLGYVILALVLLEQCLPLRGARMSSSLAGGISTGLAAGVLLFLKMNYFVAALFVIAGASILFPKKRSNVVGMIGGFIAVVLAAGIYLRWDFYAMLNDILIAGLARRARLEESHGLIRALARNGTEIVCFLLLATLSALSPKPLFARFQSYRGLGTLIFVLLVLLCDLTLACSNTQRSGFPLTLVATLIICHQLTTEGINARSRTWSHFGLPLIVVTVAITALLPTIVNTANAWGIIVAERSRTSGDLASQIDAPILRNLQFEDHSDPTGADHAENNGRLYTEFINEGITLLRAHSGPADSIGCLCFSNPFSYALMRPPARGGSTFFDYGTNFTEKYLPAADDLLGDAVVVMYPKKHYGLARLNVLFDHCRLSLSRSYQVVGESENWILFKNKSRLEKGSL